MDEIELACDRILPNSFLYQEVEPDIRRAVTHKFPYLVFYTFDEQPVQVLSVILFPQHSPGLLPDRLQHIPPLV
jgi:hypothetical protein